MQSRVLRREGQRGFCRFSGGGLPLSGLVPIAFGVLLGLSCRPSVHPGSPIAEATSHLSELEDLAQRFEALGRFSGALGVLGPGEFRFARGYGFADREARAPSSSATAFDLASLTKQFTATAILKLEAEGRLGVEDPISKHLPDYPRPAGDRVTIHHLLSHTSGIPSLWRLGDGLESVESSGDPISLEHLVELFDEMALLFAPGERYRYSNSGYVVLAAIIEAVAGIRYEDYLERALFEPLGMQSTGCRSDANRATPYWGYVPDVTVAPREHVSWSLGDGCVHSSVDDLLLWAEALRDDRLLPEVARRKLFTPHVEIRPGLSYGYGWFLSTFQDRPVARHSGAGEGTVAEMYLFLEDDLAAVALSNYAPRPGIDAPRAILETAAAIRLGLPFEPPPAVEERSESDLAPLAGLYLMDDGGGLEVGFRDGRLWVEAPGDARRVFDYSVLNDPGAPERAVEAGGDAITAAFAGKWEQIRLCEDLASEVPVEELRADWQGLLGPTETLVEWEPQSVGRYPGDATLIFLSRVEQPGKETYFALDLTETLEVCGWYAMGPEEYALRRDLEPPDQVPMLPLGPDRFLLDGFNRSEKDLLVSFERSASGVELVIQGVSEHRGRRVPR